MRKVVFYISWTLWGLLFGGSVIVLFSAFSYEVNSASFFSHSDSDGNTYITKASGDESEDEDSEELSSAMDEINNLASSTISVKDKSSISRQILPKTFSDIVQAGAFVVGDIESGEILVARNRDTKYPIASVSKLVTAVVVNENIDSSDSILITASALNTEGNSAYLKRGERVLATDLMYPLLIVSSNDSAEAFAEHYGRTDFIRKMNERAVSIGAWNTRFFDPSGLSSGNTSTAYDIFQITKWIREYHPGLLAITKEKVKKTKNHTWTNSMRFLNMSSYESGKTGYTTEAMKTATLIFELKDAKGNKRHINIALLHSPNRNRDTLYLLEYLTVLWSYTIKKKNHRSKNFWLELSRPFFALAPMSDVTDLPFRKMIAKYSKINKNKDNLGANTDIVLWTEFVSADGLCSRGREKLMHILKYSKGEHPIVAQIFGANPRSIRESARLIEELGFDGLDINMGCPDKSVEKQGAGASLIKNPKLAREIIRSARLGAPNIPISVKTRVGYNKPILEEWIKEILEEGVDALTIHARTRKELSNVPANWDFVRETVLLKDKISPKTIIIGNGDIESLSQAKDLASSTGADGVMVGRGVFGNPWFFNTSLPKITVTERLKVMVEHTILFEKELGEVKNFAVMKKHFKAYVSGWNGAKELRIKLMEAKNTKEIKNIVKSFLKSASPEILNSVILNK